jgi:hypothetical protein
MEKISQSPLFWLIAYAAVFLSRVPLKELLKAIGSFATDMKQQSEAGGRMLENANGQVFKTLGQIFDLVIESLKSSAAALGGHIANVLEQFTKEKSNVSSRVLGSVISLAVLLLFLYADATLGLQTAQTLFQELTIPAFFGNIGIALVAASVGTIFGLGMLFWDVLGFSDLTTVGKLKGVWKGVYIGFVVVAAVFAMGCVVLMALNRAVLVAAVDSIARFSPQLSGLILRWASVAHSLLIVPLLATTFLMYRGTYGLLAVYLLIPATAWLLCQFLCLFLGILKKAVSGYALSEPAASGLLSTIINLALSGIAGVLGFVAGIAGALTSILQHVLDVVTAPPIEISDFVKGSVATIQRSTAKPPPGINKLLEQQLRKFLEDQQRLRPDLGDPETALPEPEAVPADPQEVAVAGSDNHRDKI